MDKRIQGENELRKKRIIKWNNQRINKSMNKQTDGSMNKWINK